MELTRRALFKALGVGAAGYGVAKIMPMGLLNVAATRHERLSQQILKARIHNQQKQYDRLNTEFNTGIKIMHEEFNPLVFEDALFVTATMKYALRDCHIPLDHHKNSYFRQFHKSYGDYIISDDNCGSVIAVGVCRMLKAGVDDPLSSDTILRGYYPEIPGKRIV